MYPVSTYSSNGTCSLSTFKVTSADMPIKKRELTIQFQKSSCFRLRRTWRNLYFYALQIVNSRSTLLNYDSRVVFSSKLHVTSRKSRLGVSKRKHLRLFVCTLCRFTFALSIHQGTCAATVARTKKAYGLCTWANMHPRRFILLW